LHGRPASGFESRWGYDPVDHTLMSDQKASELFADKWLRAPATTNVRIAARMGPRSTRPVGIVSSRIKARSSERPL
jgi:hypothetical protein